MILSNKVYDTLKWIAQYLIPALGTLYFTIAGIWGLPYGEQVLGTLTAIDLFLAAILGLSAAAYRKTGTDGVLLIDSSDPERDIYRFEPNGDPATYAEKKTITLTVDPNANLSQE